MWDFWRVSNYMFWEVSHELLNMVVHDFTRHIWQFNFEGYGLDIIH